MRVHMLIGVLAALFVAPAVAQVRSAPASSASDQDDEQPFVLQQQQRPLNTNQAGRPAVSSVGEVGQRQTRESAAAEAGIKPMARISNRIENRVQSRLANRIDRGYNPQANATSPFAAAEAQARTSGRPR